jgi:hypothetical protein
MLPVIVCCLIALFVCLKKFFNYNAKQKLFNYVNNKIL